MKVGSLFSGIGGIDKGFEDAGFETAFQVEIDKQALKVLERHFPNAVRFDDIRTVGKHNLPGADILVGGFPCQDLSVAGHRKGLAGGRSGLWFQYHRLIAELRPKWVVIENVPGLLSSHQGRDFSVVLAGLTGKLFEPPEGGWKSGGFARGYYNVAWRVLDAQYYGVPQRRRRVFIIASLGTGGAAEVLFNADGISGIAPQGREARKTDPRTSQERAGGDCQPPRVAIDGTADNRVSGTISCTWAKGHGGPSGDETYNLQIWEPRSADGTPRFYKDISPTLNTMGGGQRQPMVGVRRIMPIECERLQGFPDGWTDNQADTRRYKQLGNAVAVPVARWIAERVADYDRRRSG